MATYPLPTLAAQVSATGISAPSYEDVLASLKASFAQIYGADVYLEPDSQDGQLLAIVALAIHDCNMAAVAVYNSFSPATAQTDALSRNVKINGLTRSVPSNSQVVVTLVGQAGTTVVAGKVRDSAGNLWALPSSVTIAPSGIATVTATCETLGAVVAPIGTIVEIATPTRGWQSVTNPSAASPGEAVETDVELKVRQSLSTSIPSKTVAQGMVGALLTLTGVSRVSLVENLTGSTDSNGIPAGHLAVVVQGGDVQQVANTIYLKKTPGVPLYGTTTVSVLNGIGGTAAVKFFVPTPVQIKVSITLHAFAAYTSDTAVAIRAALVAYINALPFGQDVFVTKLYLPAQLFGGSGSDAFELVTLTVARDAGAFSTSDIAIAFYEQATCVAGDVTITPV